MDILRKIVLGFTLIALFLIASPIFNSHSDAGNAIKPVKITGSVASSASMNKLVYDYDTLIRSSIQEENIPGLAVAIIRNNRVVFLKGYGVKEAGGSDSIDIHTIFRLGSVSKGFAAVLAGLLVEDKTISWDDDLVKYIPDFKLKDTIFSNHITIRHILSQTSGLPMHTYTDMLDYNVPFDQIKPLLATVSPIAPPGKEYSYQNVVYSLIADVVKAATSTDYNTLVRNRIFIPLYMQDASIDYESMASATDVAKPHAFAGSMHWKAMKLNNRYYSASPASGVNASISDMAQWLLALVGNYPEFIPESSLTETYKPEIVTPIRRHYRHNWKNLGELYYGMGWRIFTCNGKKIIYHGGYVKGYRAEIAFSYEEKTGIAVLFNSSCRFANKCVPEFWELYFASDAGAPFLAEK